MQFLISIFELLAGLAMMFLGISYSEPEACDSIVQLVPAHYSQIDAKALTSPIACATFDDVEKEATEVFRI
ncbi:MAG: hypothetical protein DHS20C06_16260 [Hyphobacterium sp.]|nr:MAG: hypothetical protein DHS20C06_16260 [Hyphobacterium sp.]